MRIADMRNKEIINALDGSRLGYICDIEINWDNGTIDSIIVPGTNKVMGIFGKNSEYVIPWERIRKVGEDIILVEIAEDKEIN